MNISYFPGETTVKARTVYNYVYRIKGKVKCSGTCKGSELVKMTQYKHHNIEQMKEFEFRVA